MNNMGAVGASTGRLSVARIAAARSQIAPAFLDSPLRHSDELSRQLGCELWLKDETTNALGSFKGRGADLFVARDGVARTAGATALVCASAGNFGLALADAGRRHGIEVVVFLATTAREDRAKRIRECGATVIQHGRDFDDAKAAACAYARASGCVRVEDGAEAAIAEGAGTIATELPLETFDAVVVPVGNGALIAGIGTWAKAHSPRTRVVAVCSAGAPVMRHSWLWGFPVTGRVPTHTIADSIAVRVAVPAAVNDLALVVDEFVAVSDRDLVFAMRQLLALTGQSVEPAAVAGLAAIATDRQRFAGLRVATILTGATSADVGGDHAAMD